MITDVVVMFSEFPWLMVMFCPAIKRFPERAPVAADTLKDTVPLPELFVGVTPVIHETNEPAVHVHELSATDGELGVAVTVAVPEPPLVPNDVVVEVTE
jgi:hypothetical protein